jgi:uroporphyrinogen decarboxylase
VFTRGGHALSSLVDSGAACVGLDWTVDLAAARREHGTKVAFQGNLDPIALLTDPATVQRAVTWVIEAAGDAPGYVFNLGHGIVPATPPDHVAVLVETVHAARVARV